jgi:hypothetical protein
MWARLLFMWPTHRIIRLAPGMYVQVLRGISKAQITEAIAAFINERKQK